MGSVHNSSRTLSQLLLCILHTITICTSWPHAVATLYMFVMLTSKFLRKNSAVLRTAVRSPPGTNTPIVTSASLHLPHPQADNHHQRTAEDCELTDAQAGCLELPLTWDLNRLSNVTQTRTFAHFKVMAHLSYVRLCRGSTHETACCASPVVNHAL